MGKKQNVSFIASNADRPNRQQFYHDFFDRVGGLELDFTFSHSGDHSYNEIDKADLVALDLTEIDDGIADSLRYAIDNHKQTFGHWSNGLRDGVSPFIRRVSHYRGHRSYYGDNGDLFSEFDNWYKESTPGLQKRILEDKDATYGCVKISQIIPTSISNAQIWVKNGAIQTSVSELGAGVGRDHGMHATRDQFIDFLKENRMWDWLGQKTEGHDEARNNSETTRSAFATLIGNGTIPSYAIPKTDRIKIPRLGLQAFMQNRFMYVDEKGRIIERE